MKQTPNFLPTFVKLVKPGSWVTSRALASIIDPLLAGDELSAASRILSQKLSNLERFGHIVRRQRVGWSVKSFEYSVKG